MEMHRKSSLCTVLQNSIEKLFVPISASLGTTIDIHIGVSAMATCASCMKFEMPLCTEGKELFQVSLFLDTGKQMSIMQ